MAGKAVRVWSADRLQRHGVVAQGWGDLRAKARLKLGLGDQPFKLVLEADGTEVDAAFWESVAPHERLVAVVAGGAWQPPPCPVPRVLCVDDDQTDAAHSPHEQTIRMFVELQNNPAALAMLSLDNLELIKDFDVDQLLKQQHSKLGLNKQMCKNIQELSIDLYVKRRSDKEAMDFIDLLKSNAQ